MSLLERVFFFHQEIAASRFPNSRTLMLEFEVSAATAKRDIAYLRDRLLAPLVFEHQKNGYRYSDDSFHLPFIQGERVAFLLAMLNRLAEEVGLGQLREVRQLTSRLSTMLGSDYSRLAAAIDCEWIEIETLRPEVFETVVGAISRRRTLLLHYRSSTASLSSRQVYPLRILNYQGRWYLRAFCCLRNDKRLFHLARIQGAEALSVPIPDGHDDNREDLGQSFGIFKGIPRYWAEILFVSVAADLVRFQRWHKDQEMREHQEGLVLRLPVNDDRELLMKILQYGSMAKVLSPPSLVTRVEREVRQMSVSYYPCPDLDPV